MANVLVEENSLSAIANAIREKNGSNATYYPADMASAILAIEGGGGGGASGEPVLEPLEVTQNGVYVPGDGVDGFSQVNVSVEVELLKGVVVNAADANGNWTDITIYGNVPANMFKGNTYLTKVEFAKNVKTIGNDAFNGCTKIAGAINIPASVTSIGAAAFRSCTGITEVRWNPPAIETVGSSSYPIFEGCKNIAKVVFASDVTILPNYLFREATGAPMGDVVLPEGLKRIGQDAFYGCGLTSINIPASVTAFGTYAFYKCTSLHTVYWNPPSITSIGSTTYPIFDSCSALKNFVIAENVTVLPQYMLRECTGIESIVIPDSVTTIGAQAFYSCSALTSVQIGETADCAITTIGANAFYTSALTEIIIYAAADSVTGSPWGASSATITWAV